MASEFQITVQCKDIYDQLLGLTEWAQDNPVIIQMDATPPMRAAFYGKLAEGWEGVARAVLSTYNFEEFGGRNIGAANYHIRNAQAAAITATQYKRDMEKLTPPVNMDYGEWMKRKEMADMKDGGSRMMNTKALERAKNKDRLASAKKYFTEMKEAEAPALTPEQMRENAVCVVIALWREIKDVADIANVFLENGNDLHKFTYLDGGRNIGFEIGEPKKKFPKKHIKGVVYAINDIYSVHVDVEEIVLNKYKKTEDVLKVEIINPNFVACRPSVTAVDEMMLAETQALRNFVTEWESIKGDFYDFVDNIVG